MVVKSMYSPFAIFSCIQDGMGGKAGLGSETNGGTDCIDGMMVALACEVLVAATCSGETVPLCTGKEVADRRSSSIAVGSGRIGPTEVMSRGFLIWRMDDSWSSSCCGSKELFSPW